MVGKLSHEIEVNVPASEAWELYGTLRLGKLIVEEAFPGIIEKIEVIEGDGEAGTIVKIIPGTAGSKAYREKFTKVDNEKRLKELEVIEGAYLEMGFTFYRVSFEIVEKGDDSCIIKTKVEYDVKEEAAANASSNVVSIEPLAKVAEAAKNHLLKNKTA
ncbi:norbelladine synthase-like [Juglans microcarpa x Juglans regia]|uniref:norbelladine synthase-like n=1 Tax=Juglans microcarpa x Juglans regia TaxID=2249226 RepID=UPI001B7E829C|nr:norbelladine synthase-like [Juglans microcarpa x Juglans regia]